MTILINSVYELFGKTSHLRVLYRHIFRKYSALVMVLLYFGGIFMAVLMAMLMQGNFIPGEAVPFVMELPKYRMPGQNRWLALVG